MRCASGSASAFFLAVLALYPAGGGGPGRRRWFPTARRFRRASGSPASASGSAPTSSTSSAFWDRSRAPSVANSSFIIGNLRRHAPIALTGYTMAIGGPLYAPLAVRELGRLPLASVSAVSWAALLYSAAFAPAPGRYRVKVAWGHRDPWIAEVMVAGPI